MKHFFKERTRIRNPVIQLPARGHGTADWTDVGVCGQVYKSAIYGLLRDVAGLKPGKSRRWLPEYKKARKAVYYSLKKDEREELKKVAERWNRKDLSAQQKTA